MVVLGKASGQNCSGKQKNSFHYLQSGHVGVFDERWASKARFPLPEVTAQVNGSSWRVTGFHYPSTGLKWAYIS